MSLKRYDIIERIGPNDVKHRIIVLDEKLPQTNKEKLELFHREYENQWDYLHQTLECGLMLQFFIHDEAPDHRWMYSSPKPKHISAVPEPIRARYINYLHKEYAKQLGNNIKEVIYTERNAANDYCNNL